MTFLNAIEYKSVSSDYILFFRFVELITNRRNWVRRLTKWVKLVYKIERQKIAKYVLNWRIPTAHSVRCKIQANHPSDGNIGKMFHDSQSKHINSSTRYVGYNRDEKINAQHDVLASVISVIVTKRLVATLHLQRALKKLALASASLRYADTLTDKS